MSEKITICALCYEKGKSYSEIKNLSAGDESWSVCRDCRAIEQDTLSISVNTNGEEIEP